MYVASDGNICGLLCEFEEIVIVLLLDLVHYDVPILSYGP